MKTSEIKKNIHKAVDKIEDTSLLQAFYTIPEKQIETEVEYELSIERKKELNKRLTNYKYGTCKSHPWNEVRKRLTKRVILN